MISLLQFRQLFPSCPKQKAADYLPLLIASMKESGITTRKRAASYFAQLGHESLDFKYMEEIASGQAYEGRRDLGNVRPGDGKKFKGRGPIQTTGRLNYSRAALALNLPLTEKPELLSIPANGFRASAFFWQSNKLNVYADALNGRGDATDLLRFDKITKRVNGGYNGRADRRRRYAVALSILTDAQFDEARVSNTPDKPTAATNSSSTAVTPEVNPKTSATPAPETEPSLIDEIPVTEETKAVGMSFLKRLGVKAGGALVALWGMGAHGRLLLIIVALALLALGYFERKALKEVARKVIRKLK